MSEYWGIPLLPFFSCAPAEKVPRFADIDEIEPGPKINLHDALLVWLPKNTGRRQGLGESDGIRCGQEPEAWRAGKSPGPSLASA